MTTVSPINLQPSGALSVDQQLTNIASAIAQGNTQLFLNLYNKALAGYNAVWNQKDQVNLNAQAILNQFGKGAGFVVQNYQAVASLINTASQALQLTYALPTTYPNGQTLTVNQDGTVTVNAASS